jgi:hypothetical protein
MLLTLEAATQKAALLLRALRLKAPAAKFQTFKVWVNA